MIPLCPSVSSVNSLQIMRSEMNPGNIRRKCLKVSTTGEIFQVGNLVDFSPLNCCWEKTFLQCISCDLIYSSKVHLWRSQYQTSVPSEFTYILYTMSQLALDIFGAQCRIWKVSLGNLTILRLLRAVLSLPWILSARFSWRANQRSHQHMEHASMVQAWELIYNDCF